MKNKYLLIDRNGKVWNPKSYRGSQDCSEDMAICIDREVFSVPVKKSESKPSYLKDAQRLGFAWEENASIGFMQYDYKANLILRLVKEYSRYLVYNLGLPIYEISGSNFFDLKHPVVQSYAKLFGDRLFKFECKDEQMIMSYDASYPQFNLAKKYRLNERDLPFAHFSISDCYRYEQSGECMLLFRGRRFNMPDIHPYFKDVDEAWQWYPILESKIQAGFKLANRNYINIAKVSSNENWNKYKEEICQIAIRSRKEVLVEIKMDNEDRYWIIDIDYSFVDSLNQIREIGCIQIDIGNAKRLGIKYREKNNKDKNPVIIHSAIPGGIERYIYMLIDKVENFPIYFHPIQLRLIPVSEKHVNYSKEIANKFPELRIDIDDRAESVAWKVKQAHIEFIPNYIVIGDKEMDEEKIPQSVRGVAKKVRKEIKNLPSVQHSLPLLLSQRIK